VAVVVLLEQAALDEVPGAHVLRLLLEPEDLLGVGVAREHRRHAVVGPRVELLDAGDGDGRAPGLLPGGDGLDADLAGREHHAAHRRRIAEVGAGVVEDLLERAQEQLTHG
jgi:hypothetical protein